MSATLPTATCGPWNIRGQPTIRKAGKTTTTSRLSTRLSHSRKTSPDHCRQVRPAEIQAPRHSLGRQELDRHEFLVPDPPRPITTTIDSKNITLIDDSGIASATFTCNRTLNRNKKTSQSAHSLSRGRPTASQSSPHSQTHLIRRAAHSASPPAQTQASHSRSSATTLCLSAQSMEFP